MIAELMTFDQTQFDRDELALRIRERCAVRLGVLKGLGYSEATLDDLSEHLANKAGFESLTLESKGQYTPPRLEAAMRRECRRAYGGILTMLLFALIWEVIKQYLFSDTLETGSDPVGSSPGNKTNPVTTAVLFVLGGLLALCLLTQGPGPVINLFWK